MLNISTRQIASGKLVLPVLGFGGAPLGGLLKAVANETAKETLKIALNAGFSYVDTAPYYGFGKSERIVGDLLRGHDYILSSKVGRLLIPGAMENPSAFGWPEPLPFQQKFDYSYDGIMRSFEDSLQRLGLDRIDILYVHDIGEVTHGANNTMHFDKLAKSGYKALAELRSNGLVKAIGLGVNEVQICRDALAIGDWDLFLLAGRYTLLEQDPLNGFFDECQQAKISIVIGGPFNSGILVGNNLWNYSEAPAEIVQKANSLKAVSDEFNVPLPAAALQFPLAHPMVVSTIPGVSKPEKLAQILEWVKITIPNEYWQALKQKGLLHSAAPTPHKNLFFD